MQFIEKNVRTKETMIYKDKASCKKCMKLLLYFRDIDSIHRPKFVDQFGHETMYVSNGNKLFFH